MALCTLVNSVRTDSAVPYMICEYSADGVDADSTSAELIEIELPNLTLSSYSHRNIPNITTTGSAYIISLKGMSISCNSTNFDISFLNNNDITALNSINEVLEYTGINLLQSDHTFDDFIIRNRDTVLDNKIYLFVNNHDVIATGTLRFELIYVAVQDRSF